MTNDKPELPVITRTPLRAYPGWEVAYNPVTKMYWANDTRGVAIGPGEETFADAVYFAKHGVPPLHNA